METKQFSTANLSEELLKAIQAVRYEEMTEIQEKAIPFVLEGRDVIGRSGTGTGKTAAFGIPAVEKIEGNPKKPQVIILSPTRELAMQTAKEMEKFSAFKRTVRVATVYGGQSMQLQINQLKTANIVIGTPGRIMDHMNRGTLKLDEIKMLILDEADEMLNMGFLDDIKFILATVPDERQTLLFSATMPPQIMKLTKEFQHDPVVVSVEKADNALDNITQYFYDIPQMQKREALNILLQMYGSNRAVVFCNTKSKVDELVEYLNDNGFKAVGLHGDMKQMVRTQVMNNFKAGRINVLIATDVAARGIDVENVKAVVNFDLPQENEYYVHRIGRTGRAGKTGTAHTLVTRESEVRKLHTIERMLKTTIARSEIPSHDEIMDKKRRHFEKKLITALETGVDDQWTFTMENLVREGFSKEDIIFCLMGMLADKNTKVLPVVPVIARKGGRNERVERFDRIDRIDRNDRNEIREKTPRSERVEGTACLRVNIGHDKGVCPNHIVGAIVEETGIPTRSIGKIDINDDFTNIQTTAEDAAVICDAMNGKKIRGVKVKFEISSDDVFARKTAGSGSKSRNSKQKSYGGYGKGTAKASSTPKKKWYGNR